MIETIIVGLIVTIIGGLIVLLICGIRTFFIRRYKTNKKNFELLWKKSSRLEPEDILRFRGNKEQGFNSYYRLREHDSVIRETIGRGKSILITGNPLSGKTRSVYETFKKLEKPHDIIIPKIKDIEDDFRIPYRITSWRKKILFLDDIDKFAKEKNFIQLLNRFDDSDITIVSTCRTGFHLEKFTSLMEKENYLPFKEQIEITSISKKIGNEIAKEINKKLPETFDGNIGSIFLPLKTMEKRFRDCNGVEKGILKSLKRLYKSGIYIEREVFSIDRIKRVSKKIEEIDKKDHELNEIFENLQKQGFLEKKGGEVRSEEAYLEKIIEDDFELLDNFKEMLNIFSDDPMSLYLLGGRAYDIGEIDIKKAEYMNVAIEAYKRALKFWTYKKYPQDYAKTKNGLGIAYWRLSEVKEKAENIERAILAFEEALEVRTIDSLPIDYAITQCNLGVAYSDLSEVRDKAENIEKTIKAYEEVLKVYTIENFPIYYAMTQYIIGLVAYGNLSEIEDMVGNVNRARGAFDEALNVFKREGLEYGSVKFFV